MLLDPVELLEQRLKEIEDVDCNDPEFNRYRLKYKTSIEFLKNHGYISNDKDNRRSLTDYDVKFIEENCNYGQLDFYAGLFKVHRSTIEKVIMKRRHRLLEKIERINLKPSA